jgi:superfamily II DNA or RNA helicase
VSVAAGSPDVARRGAAALPDDRPVPCVRLFADRVVVTSTDGLSCSFREALVPLLALSFAYADESCERSVRAEHDARRVIERLGAVELACIDSIAPPDGCDAEYVVRADGDEQSFCAFTARALECWRSLGWRVEVDAGYPFRVLGREAAWYARVEPSDERADWFGLELGVEIDGERVDLLPVLLDVLERTAEQGGGLEELASSYRSTWALRVSDTHHVTLPMERLRALLRVVAELYQGEHRRGCAFPELRAGALLEIDDAFRRDGAGLKWSDRAGITERARARVATPPQPVALPCGLRATLRPYQAEGVAFLQRVREAGLGGVLADEMGLGKTLQTIAHVCLEHEQGRLTAPVLVVAPTTLVGNWAREIARFAPALRVVILHGAARGARWDEVPAAHVVVTTYPVLVRDEDRFAAHTFHLVILDEAQAIKNSRSQARRVVERIEAGHRICLTGTPIENNLGELWSIFDWLSPGVFGDELAFRRFWRQPIEQRGDSERLAALRELIAPWVLRRLKRDVARELPPKTELSTPVEFGPEQRELYEAIRVAAHADVRRAIRAKGIAASAVTILDALTKLRQVCCDPRLVAMDAARRVEASAKLSALFDLLQEQIAGGHRVLVFSQFTSMLALVSGALRARGIAHLALTGKTRDRQRVVDAFEGGRAPVFLISLKAGGTGLNLTSADTVVHYDPWWNPAAQAQATDRAYRIGQTRPVFVHNLYVCGTVEERVLALQQRKKWLSATLLGDGGGPSGLHETDIDALFAPIDG